jgi:hypothetical protein
MEAAAVASLMLRLQRKDIQPHGYHADRI